MDLSQGRIHHQDQADRYGNVGGTNGEFIDEAFDTRQKVSQPDANCHCKENP
jgi:hypothetical protein